MAVNIGPKIGIDGEAEYRKQINNIIQQAKTLDSEMRAVTSAFTKDTTAKEKNEAISKVLSQQVEVQKKRVEELTKMLKKSSELYGENDDKTLRWKEAVNDATAQLNKMARELAEGNDEAKKMGDSLDDTGKDALSFGDVLKANVIGDLITNGLQKLADGLREVGAAAKEAFTDTVQWADDLATLSTQTGLSTNTLQEFEYMADLMDTDVDTITGSMAKLTKNMNTARKGTNDAAVAFKTLGINIQNQDGTLRDNQAVFYETIEALGAMSNETERDALSMSIFGKSAQDLNPLIATGADGMAAFAQEAHDMGYVLENDAINSLLSVSDSMARIENAGETFKRSISAAVAPAVSELSDSIVNLLTNNEAFKSSIGDLVSGAGSLAAEVLPVLAQMLGTIAPVLAEIASGAAPVLQDFFAKIEEPMRQITTDVIPQLLELFVSLAPIVGEIVSLLASLVGDIFSVLVPIVKDIVENLLPIAQKIIEGLSPILQNLFENLSPIIDQLWAAIEEILPILINILGDVIENILPIIIKLIEGLMPLISEILSEILPVIIDLIKELLPIVKTIIDAVLPVLNTLLDTLIPILETVFDAIQPILDIVVELFDPIIKILSECLVPLIELLGPIIELLGGILMPILEDLGPILEIAFWPLKAVVIPIIETVISVISKLIGWIKDVINWFGKLFGATDRASNLSRSVSKSSSYSTAPSAAGYSLRSSTAEAESVVTPEIVTRSFQASSLDSVAEAARYLSTAERLGLSSVKTPDLGFGQNMITNYGGVTINVNAQPGQDVNDIADAVMIRMENAVRRKEAVFA